MAEEFGYISIQATQPHTLAVLPTVKSVDTAADPRAHSVTDSVGEGSAAGSASRGTGSW